MVDDSLYLSKDFCPSTYDYKHPAQLQTVIPPSLKADGTPRVWTGGPDILPLPETVYADLEQNLGKQKQSKKPTAATYVWPPDIPAETIVLGKLLGGIDPTDTELALLTPETHALVDYLHVVEPTSERYWMLLSYPVAVLVPGIPPKYNPDTGTMPPPGYRWKAPADPAKVALVDRILATLPPVCKGPTWAEGTAKPTPLQTQVGPVTWTPTLLNRRVTELLSECATYFL
jgi:hypothetical protein